MHGRFNIRRTRMSVDSETKDGRKSINKRERQKDNERINKKNKKQKEVKKGGREGQQKGGRKTLNIHIILRERRL